MSADKVKFRKPVRPGDQLQIHAKLTKVRSGKIAVAEATCSVDGQVVSSADLMIAIGRGIRGRLRPPGYFFL